MEINYTIFDKEGFDKIPLIGFDDKQYIGLEDLLNVDFSSITLDDILNKINKVENEESNFEEIGTERSMVEIKIDYCTIYDIFVGLIDDDELNPTVILPTYEFKKIVVDWKKERRKLLDKINDE